MVETRVSDLRHAPVGLSDLGDAAPKGAARRRPPMALAVSLAGHALALVALLSVWTGPPAPPEMRVMSLTLVEPPMPAEPIKPEVPSEPSPEEPPPQRNIFRETKAPPPADVEPLPAGEAETPSEGVEVSDAEVAGAATAGTGATSGGCNMPRLLQNALRKDPLVQAAVAQAHVGKPIMVWNGGWVRRGDQEGHGLAAVREAMMWEIGFAPKECRSQRVHGLVLLSLNDSPGAARLVLGDGDWRWTDLLF